ncbi:sulfatase [bacterium]|nr:sulfatase [bacterium]
MSFITRGSQSSLGFWFNPVLYTPSKKKPNVILISLDTLRADHLGCYGYERNTTPHIDSFSSQSALFSNVYTSSPWTLPSHVSLLTSLFGVHHQVYNEDEKMDPSMVTLADVLRQESYFCSAFTGGALVSALYGFSKGFDSYRQTARGFWRKDAAEDVGQKACHWLERNKEKNFFLFLHTYQPHNPYSSPSPYRSLFLSDDPEWKSIDLLHHLGGKKGVFKALSPRERRNIINLYDGEIRYTDEKLVYPVLEKLKELGLYEQTLIVLTSDHGEEFYDHKGWEHGHTLYDELLKVPLIIKFPQGRFAGEKIDSIVRLVDIMPTLLEELGIPYSDYELDGRSLIPFLEGKESQDRVFLADKGDNIVGSHIPQKISMNKGSKKLILNQEFNLQEKNFFTFPPPAVEPVEIYDLDKDPEEKQNIADQNSTLAHQIIKAINDLYEEAKKRKKFKAQIDKETEEQLKALGYIR